MPGTPGQRSARGVPRAPHTRELACQRRFAKKKVELGLRNQDRVCCCCCFQWGQEGGRVTSVKEENDEPDSRKGRNEQALLKDSGNWFDESTFLL